MLFCGHFHNYLCPIRWRLYKFTFLSSCQHNVYCIIPYCVYLLPFNWLKSGFCWKIFRQNTGFTVSNWSTCSQPVWSYWIDWSDLDYKHNVVYLLMYVTALSVARVIWYDIYDYDMIYDMIWYDIIRYMVWYDMIRYMIYMIWYDML